VLLFFDIDATLITTSRSGIAAMGDIGRELFGEEFTVEGVEFAGGLDPLIIADLLRVNRVEVSRSNLGAFREGYRRCLEARLADRSKCRALPGVMELLGRLREMGAARGGNGAAPTLALLTGNFAETGSIKLRACGIDPEWFAIRVWGDESPHHPPRRDHLPGVGLDRYTALTGRRLEGRLATVIGDTPHDVSCARAHRCRSLGVATGSFTVEALTQAGADMAMKDLSDTDRVLDWLLGVV
jgi:phosphoglycolate phosphatase